MSAPIEVIRSRLDNVRGHGTGAFRADCPLGHRSRGTLSVHEGDNNVVLLKCWAGCGAAEIVGALGLTLADLFPEKIPDYSPRGRRAAAEFRSMAGWKAALSVLARECVVVAIAAAAVRDGEELTHEDRQRLAVACERIDAARAVLT